MSVFSLRIPQITVISACADLTSLGFVLKQQEEKHTHIDIYYHVSSWRLWSAKWNFLLVFLWGCVFGLLTFTPFSVCSLMNQRKMRSFDSLWKMCLCLWFRDFLPRGSGIVTRRPLILQLVNSKAGKHCKKNTLLTLLVHIACLKVNN